MNRRQIAESARRLRPDLQVLFITGYAENAVLNHGHIERGMEVLTKPFAVDDLVRRVSRLLQASSRVFKPDCDQCRTAWALGVSAARAATNCAFNSANSVSS